MRIVSALEYSYFNHNPQEIQPLKDFFDIFHGRYICTKTHAGLDQFTYDTPNNNITGHSIPLGGYNADVSNTTIRISQLELPEQAACWTTAEVYKQQYYKQYETTSFLRGFHGRPLTLVSPDQRGIVEGVNRSYEPDFKIDTTYDERGVFNDKKVSIFIAFGDDLLAAAKKMVEGYNEYVSVPVMGESLAALDASMTVAQALGSTSMESFEEMWLEATQRPNPQDAARYAYKTLRT